MTKRSGCAHRHHYPIAESSARTAARAAPQSYPSQTARPVLARRGCKSFAQPGCRLRSRSIAAASAGASLGGTADTFRHPRRDEGRKANDQSGAHHLHSSFVLGHWPRRSSPPPARAPAPPAGCRSRNDAPSAKGARRCRRTAGAPIHPPRHSGRDRHALIKSQPRNLPANGIGIARSSGAVAAPPITQQTELRRKPRQRIEQRIQPFGKRDPAQRRPAASHRHDRPGALATSTIIVFRRRDRDIVAD